MITRTETPGASTHIEDTVQAIARLRADHNRRATALQRRVDYFTAHVGSPGFVVLLTLLVASWIALTSHHEQLTLELAILSEQKAAKIISLLEELRQDHPEIHNRVDHEAAAMSAPADPKSVLESIKKHLSDDA
jgi:uncharacterized membrane protein